MGRQAELVFQRDGETGRALDRLSRALEALELSDPLAEGQLLVRAGHILAATGDLDQAQERFFRALDVLGGARDRQADLAKAEALKGLAEVGRKTGDVGQAEKMLLEALALEEAVLPPGSPVLATAYERISSFYREVGNESAARYYAERAGSRPR
jgi:tetratricopeptide (TPR) repeat protein